MHTTPSHRRLLTTLTLGLTFGVLGPLALAPAAAFADRTAGTVTGLAIGSEGDDVKSVQQALVSQGLSVGAAVDGIFGPGTESALKRFQSWHGLNQTGVVDDATALALGLSSSTLLGLSQGQRGDAVATLQQKLANVGIDVGGGIDGIFGAGTTAALKEFQTSKGYSPTGSVNAATAAALERIKGSAKAPDATSPATPEPDTKADAADASATQPEGLVGLKIGARGDGVVRLQRTIMAAGFTVVGGADGIFGALTANALKSFQNANGLDASGVVDDATVKALDTIDIGGSASGSSSTDGSNPLVGLRFGSIGDDVKSLQRALLDAGLTMSGGADGIFGPATRDALSSFQKAQGLEANGSVDAATAAALASGTTATSDSSLVGLQAGALGNTVKSLQQKMIDAGVTVRGGADGIFGPATANAVKDFQRSQGLDATGVVDQKTADALSSPKRAAAAKAPAAAQGGFAEYGEHGTRVVALQTALVAAGVTVRGGIDGSFGGGTSAAVMEFQRREGLSVSGKVSEATAQRLGLARMATPPTPDPVSVRLESFPVQGRCGFIDTWHATRGGGRTHLGVDIIAGTGQPIVAVTGGTITKVYTDYPGSLAGNGVRLTMADGTYFFYAHMQEVASGIAEGTKVGAGQALGTVGSTGNSGTPHLHLEVHPKGGSAVNPYPLVKALGGCGG